MPTNYDDETIHSMTSGRLVPGIDASIEGLQKAVTSLSDGEPPARQSARRRSHVQGGHRGRPNRRASAGATEVVHGLDPTVPGAQAFSEGGDDLGGGDAFVAGGYDKVPQLLARDLDVRTSMPIASVVVDQGQVVATPQTGAGMTYAAAIVAVPPRPPARAPATFTGPRFGPPGRSRCEPATSRRSSRATRSAGGPTAKYSALSGRRKIGGASGTTLGR